jgi:hypothetical protein
MRLINRQTNITLAFVVVLIFSILPELWGQTDPVKPYPQLLFSSFTKSIVKLKSGSTRSAMLNYNTVDEEMVFDQRGVYYVLDKPEEIDSVFIQNRKFIPVGKCFYEIAVEGPVTFFIQNKSRYTTVGTTTAYGIKSQTLGPSKVLSAQAGNQSRHLEIPDDVTVSPATVYWVRKNNEMFKFNSERQFLKIFPEKELQIKEFIKKSKINFKSREDFIKLGIFCNEIVK